MAISFFKSNILLSVGHHKFDIFCNIVKIVNFNQYPTKKVLLSGENGQG